MLFSISPSFEIKLCTKLSRSLISILGFQGLFIPFIIGKVSIIEALGMTFVLLVICYYLHSFTVKMLRKQYNLTQEELSLKSGVGLRFVRDLEQGKETLRLDKVNQLLDFFNYEMVATSKTDNQ